MPCSFAGIVLTVLALTVEVKLQSDFNFTCTSPWTDGAVANSECVIPRDKFRNKTVGGICDIYSDTVVFTLTKADGNYSTCTVTKFDTTCDASLNADGCGCREISGGTIIIDYNITAVRADHQGAQIKCEPQCLDSNGLATILKASTANDCFNISVVVPTTTPTVAPTTSPPDTTSAPPGTSAPGSDLLWLLLLLLLIPPLILIIIFCCPCGNIACHWCCCTGRCYCRCADKAGAGCCGAAWCKKEDNFISHVCYLCGYKKVKEEEEFICCSLEKCEVVPTTRSGQRDNKVDADHVATNGARNRERVSTPVQETELTKVRETSSPPSGEEETSPNGAS